jgi:hypothetical protein
LAVADDGEEQLTANNARFLVVGTGVDPVTSRFSGGHYPS